MKPNFRPHTLWRHKEFRDVDMYVVSVQSLKEFVNLSVLWMHRRIGMIDLPEQAVQIVPDQYDNWTEVNK